MDQMYFLSVCSYLVALEWNGMEWNLINVELENEKIEIRALEIQNSNTFI